MFALRLPWPEWGNRGRGRRSDVLALVIDTVTEYNRDQIETSVLRMAWNEDEERDTYCFRVGFDDEVEPGEA